jgi:hypothetical protein
MSEMAKSLAKLLPIIFDDEKSLDAEARKVLKEELKSLQLASQNMRSQTGKHGSKVQDRIGNDPALEYMAKEFGTQIDIASDNLANGEVDFARLALRPAISYCISCHTRSSQGPSFPTSPFQDSIAKLKSTERMAVYTATRQYDLALKEYGNVLRDAKGAPLKIEKATRMALAVSVRAQENPKDALRILDQVSTAPGLLKSTERLIKAWRQSVAEWMAEKEQDPQAAPFERARNLIRKAESSKLYLADGAGDINYLRATSILHDLLRKETTGLTRAEIEFALGKSYEVIRDLGFWDLHETYFEACVRDAPHTPIAKQCFERFEESVVLGYSGTAGTFIPSLVSKKISELKTLSEIKKK